MFEKMIELQQKRRSKKGGFTLVELIVVLVILAILAALLIPALTGYIDKAKEKSITAECRQVVMAAQTLYDEAYGKIKLGGANNLGFDSANAKGIHFKDVADLAEVDEGNIYEITVDTTSTIATKANKITKVTYARGGQTCTYDGSAYTVTKGTPAKKQAALS